MIARLKSSLIAIAGAGLLAMAGASLGQQRIIIRQNGAPLQMIIPAQPVVVADPGGQDESGEVYVRDSAIAMEKLALARRMERAHDWAKAADVYQEILEKYPDRVVPAGDDSQTHNATRYTSVTATVRDALSNWPVDGLSVYRSRYETIAEGLLAQAGSDGLNKLHEILALYFPTDAAKIAGIRLMDFYFEQGDYAAVNDIGKQLLKHPDLVAERPMVLYRTALAAKLADQPDEANALLAELRQQFPKSTGVVRGNEVLLIDSLAQELADAAVIRIPGSDSWQTFGGDESRGKICTSTVKPGTRLYAIPMMRFSWGQLPESPNRAQLEAADEEQRKKGAGLGIMPVVDNGDLFFQDNARIYAIDLDSGVALPGWVDTYPMQNGQYVVPGNPAPMPLGKQLCLSVNDKYVTAVMGLGDPLSQVPGPANQDSILVCLDRNTGKNLWTFAPRDFPDSQAALHELRMGGAPLMVGDNVYVMVHGARGQFEDCYVACFSLHNGEFRWATFIANSGITAANWQFQEDSILVSDAVSHIAYAGGKLFVVSNIGAIASLDAYTGTIAWLNIYRSENQSTNATDVPNPALMNPNPAMLRAMAAQPMGIPLLTTSVPWIYNAAVIQNGKLFALPSDSHTLLVCDAGSGDVLKKIQLADPNLQESRDANGAYVPDIPNTLLGVRDDLVYVAGSRQVWQIPWEQIEPGKSPDLIPGYWRSADSSDPASQIRGRGFVTADAVYVPTQSSLKRIALATGEIESSFPKNGWEAGKEGAGNVIVTQDHVIVAGDAQLAIYTDIVLARAKLDRAVAEAPADPDVRLHYAEVMFAGAQSDVAQAQLEEAFELLGGVQSLRVGKSREKAFEDSLSFATQSAARSGNAAQTDRFFDLAEAAAFSASQQVKYRMARAAYGWDRPARDAASAIELYQEVLGDSAYRAMAMPDPLTGDPSQAGVIADKAIRKIQETPDGQEAYAKFEKLAAQKLHDAQAAGEPDQLLNVAKAYPDSRVRTEAMMSAASLYEDHGNARSATEVLRELLQTRQDQDRVPVLEALARNYLRMPGYLDVAVRRMQAAANLEPLTMLRLPVTLPNGQILQNTSLGNASAAIMQYEAQSNLDALPDLHLPTHDQETAYQKATGQFPEPFQPYRSTTSIEGVDALVAPMEGFSRNDRIIAWSGASGLAVYAVGGTKPLFTSPAVNQSPVGAAWMSGGLAIWSYGWMAMIDDSSGSVKWSVDLAKLPAIVAAGQAAPELQISGREEIYGVVPTRDRIIVATTAERVLAIDSSAGRVSWQARAGGTINTLLATDDFAVIRSQDNQTVNVEVFNSATGELQGKKSFGMDTQIYPINLALGQDGTLVYTLPNQLCIQDLSQANLSPQGMEPGFVTDAGPTSGPNATQLFLGAGQPEPDQLLIHGGRVFAVANSGKEVRIFSLETGDPWSYPQGGGRNPTPVVLSTDSTNPNPRLHISGNYLFISSPRNLTAHRIDPPTAHWGPYSDPTKSTNFCQMLFGRDYLALVDRPQQPLSEGNRPGKRLTLNFFNRSVKRLKDEEAGALLYTVDLPVVQGTATLQAIDGGIVYFTGHTIQVFMGARETLPGVPPV